MTNPARAEPTTGKILVVEDEEALCFLYEEEFGAEGYAVRSARDLSTAFRLLDEDPPDLVVLDIRLREENGIDAMGRILDRKEAPRIVLNTAYRAYRDDFRSWGADAYVVKSSDLSELKSAVHGLMKPRAA